MNTWENLRARQRRVPLGVQILVVFAVGSIFLVLLVAFGPPLPGPSVFYDEPPLACTPGDTEVRAPTEPQPGPGSWRPEPSLPMDLDEAQATAVGDRVFVGTGSVAGDDRTVSVDQLYTFDPRRGQYEEPTTTPEPLDHSRLVTYRGDLYVVGGFSNGEPTSGLWRYSPLEGEWTELESMSEARGAHGAAVIGDRLYVVGGTREAEGVAPTATMEVYDFNTGEWSNGPDAPTARHHLGVAALDGKLYAVGGRAVGNFALDTVERFDPASARWETLPPLPQGAGGLAVTAANGELWAIAGGDDELEWITAATWAFDPERGEWRRAADTEVPRHGQAVATVDGRIYIFGGAPCSSFGLTDSVESLPTR
jgi:Kelch motif protein